MNNTDVRLVLHGYVTCCEVLGHWESWGWYVNWSYLSEKVTSQLWLLSVQTDICVALSLEQKRYLHPDFGNSLLHRTWPNYYKNILHPLNKHTNVFNSMKQVAFWHAPHRTPHRNQNTLQKASRLSCFLDQDSSSGRGQRAAVGRLFSAAASAEFRDAETGECVLLSGAIHQTMPAAQGASKSASGSTRLAGLAFCSLQPLSACVWERKKKQRKGNVEWGRGREFGKVRQSRQTKKEAIRLNHSTEWF